MIQTALPALVEDVHGVQPYAQPSFLDRIAEQTALIGQRYMPTLSPKQFSEREGLLRELRDMLVEGVDYGVIPGTEKPTLLLPGAQKLCTFFGYVPHYEVRQIEDWTGVQHDGEMMFYYDFTCVLLKDTKPVGEGRGSCNSWESKYRYRWVGEDAVAHLSQEDFDALPTRGGRISEPVFAIDKAETAGKYGKPMEYWERFRAAIQAGTATKGEREKKGGGKMPTWEIDATLYRVPNEGIPDIVNTVQKMGQKRAYIAATLSATGASQYFTQDIEDWQDVGHVAPPAAPEPAQPQPPNPPAKARGNRWDLLKGLNSIKADLFNLHGSHDAYYEYLKANDLKHSTDIKDNELAFGWDLLELMRSEFQAEMTKVMADKAGK